MSSSKGSMGAADVGGFQLDHANMSFTLTEDSESISGASGNKQQLLFGSFAGGSNSVVSEEMLMTIHSQLFPGASNVKNQLNFGSVIPENYSPINAEEPQFHERQNTLEKEEIIRLQENQFDEEDDDDGSERRANSGQSSSYKGQRDGDNDEQAVVDSTEKDKLIHGSSSKDKNQMSYNNTNNNQCNNSNNKSQFKTYKQYVVSKEVLQDEGMFAANRKGKEKVHESESIPSSRSFTLVGGSSSKSNRNMRNQMKYNNNRNNSNKSPNTAAYRSSGVATSAECLYQLGGSEMTTVGNQTGFLCGNSSSEVNRSETTRSCQTTNNHSSSHSNPILLQPSGSRELELLKKLEDQEDAFVALQKQVDLLKNEREKLISRLNARELLLAAECQTTERDSQRQQLASTTARLEKSNEQLLRENKQLQQELIKHKTESFQKYEDLKKSNDELLETYQEKFTCQMQIQEDAFVDRIRNVEKELAEESMKRGIAEKAVRDQGLEVIHWKEQNRLLEENVKQLVLKNEQYSNVQKFLDVQQQLYLDSLSKSFLVQNGNSNNTSNNQGVVSRQHQLLGMMPTGHKDSQIGEENMNMQAIWQNSDEFDWMKKIAQQGASKQAQQPVKVYQKENQKEKSKSSEKWSGLDIRKDHKSKGINDKSRSKNSNDRSKVIVIHHNSSMQQQQQSQQQKKHKADGDWQGKDHSKEKKNKSKNKLEVVLQVESDREDKQKNSVHAIKKIDQGTTQQQEEQQDEIELANSQRDQQEGQQQQLLGESSQQKDSKDKLLKDDSKDEDDEEDDSFMASPSQKEQQQQFQLELRQAKITQAAQQYSYSTQITKRNHHNNNSNATTTNTNIIHRHYPSSSSSASISNSAPRERQHNDNNNIISNTSRLATQQDHHRDINQEQDHTLEKSAISPRDFHSDRSFTNPPLHHDESLSQLAQSLQRISNNIQANSNNSKSFINKPTTTTTATTQQIAASIMPITATSSSNLNAQGSIFRHETIKGVLLSKEKATSSSSSAKQIRAKKPKKTDQHSFYNTLDDCSSSSFLGQQQLQLPHKPAAINNADSKKKCFFTAKQQNVIIPENLNNSQMQHKQSQQQINPGTATTSTTTNMTNSTNPAKFLFTQQSSSTPQIQQASQFLKQQLSPAGPAKQLSQQQLQQRSFLKLNNLQSAISNQSLLLSEISQDQSSVFSPRTPFTHRQATQPHPLQRLDIVSDRSAVNHNSSNKSQIKFRPQGNITTSNNNAHSVSLQAQSTTLSDREELQTIKQKLKINDNDSNNRSIQLNQTSVLSKIHQHIQQQQQLQEQQQQQQQQQPKQIRQQGTSKQLQQLLQHPQQNKPNEYLPES